MVIVLTLSSISNQVSICPMVYRKFSHLVQLFKFCGYKVLCTCPWNHCCIPLYHLQMTIFVKILSLWHLKPTTMFVHSVSNTLGIICIHLYRSFHMYTCVCVYVCMYGHFHMINNLST